MTRLEKINKFREEEGWEILDELPDLGSSCERCGEQFTEDCIGGGRCLSCGKTILPMDWNQIEEWENEV